MNVSSDQLKKAEQYLQISNSYQTLSDLRGYDKDYLKKLHLKNNTSNAKNNPHTSPWWIIQSFIGTAMGLGPILMNIAKTQYTIHFFKNTPPLIKAPPPSPPALS